MLKSLTGTRARLAIDLETIRDTLLYMESDVRHAAGMEKIAVGLRATLREIEAFEAEERSAGHPSGSAAPAFAPQFVPLSELTDLT